MITVDWRIACAPDRMPVMGTGGRVVAMIDADTEVAPGTYYLCPMARPAARAEGAGPLTLAEARGIAMASLGPFGDCRVDMTSYEDCCQVGYRLSPVPPPVEALVLTTVVMTGPTWEAVFAKMLQAGFPVIGWQP